MTEQGYESLTVDGANLTPGPRTYGFQALLIFVGISVALIVVRWCSGERHTEVSHAITSLTQIQADAARLLEINRGHWGIENRLHWVRDVTMGEDTCRARTGQGPENLATLRNAAITLLRHTGHKAIASALRDLATKPLDLLRILSRFKK